MYLIKNDDDFINYYINKNIDWPFLVFTRRYLGGNAVKYAVEHKEENDRFKLLSYVYQMYTADNSAIKDVEKLAEKDMPFAYLFIADLYDRNSAEWNKYINEAAKKGVINAKIEIALNELEKKDLSALNKLEEYGKQGSSRAYYIMSKYYAENNDIDNARKYLLLAAEDNDPDALNTLASLYTYKNIVVEANHEKAVEYAQKAFDLGDDDSGILLARLLYSSADLDHDFQRAERVLAELSEAGNAEAKFRLLDLWAQAGVDEKKYGNEYFKTANEAIEGGCYDAYIFLGICYANGIGCELNYDKALEAYDKGIKYLESLKGEDVEGRIKALREQIEEVNKKK